MSTCIHPNCESHKEEEPVEEKPSGWSIRPLGCRLGVHTHWRFYNRRFTRYGSYGQFECLVCGYEWKGPQP